MLWANLHLLFWLSLFPFSTAWMGENHFSAAAGRVLRRGAAVMAAIAYYVLAWRLVAAQRRRLTAGSRAWARL